MMSPAISRHRPTVLRAAVEILAEHGARALTHAAVDRRAEVAKGTTSNYFRTRDALLGGVLDYLLEQDELLINTFDAAAELNEQEVTRILIELANHFSGPARTLTLARYTLFLEATGNPQLRTRVATARTRLNELGETLLRGAGVSEPSLAAQRIMTALDGYLIATLGHGAITASAEQILTPIVAAAFHPTDT